MNDTQWLEKNISNDVEIIEYLAELLSNFMAVNRQNRQKWTKLRVASEITSHPEIMGVLNDTTLGRFLNPSHSQQPSPETTRMVAHFLMLHGEITRRDLELISASPDIRLAAATSRFYGLADTAAQATFLRSLEGHYLVENSAGGFMLFTRLILEFRPEATTLQATEIKRLYRVQDDPHLEAWKRALRHGIAREPGRVIAHVGGQEIDSSVSSGFALAGSDLYIVLLRAAGRGLSGALNISTIEFDEAEAVRRFSASRNTGWSEQVKGEITPPIIVTPQTPPRDIIKVLGQVGDFYKGAGQNREFDKRTPDTIPVKDALKFLDTTIDYENEIMDDVFDDIEIGDKTPDEQLILALEWCSLEVFQAALDAGANPNLIPEGAADPVVFLLAADGKSEWVEALLATGRCDVTSIGANGMTASYRPAVLARVFATHSETRDDGDLFAGIVIAIRNERARQLEIQEDTPSP